jgi:hypothetical protein
MHFSPTRRLALLLILTLLFFLSVFAITAYSFGYRYAFDQGIFIHSGSILLKTNPSRVSLFLNDKPLEQKRISFINGSYQINGLRPGRYKIAVTAPGFDSWTKHITVESGKASEFWNILLTRNDYETQNIPLRNVTRLYPSPEGQRLAVSQFDGEETSIVAVNADGTDAIQVFSSLEYIRPDTEQERERNIEWSPNEEFLIIPVQEKSSSKTVEYFIVNRETLASKKLSSLTKEESFTPYSVRWGTGNNNIYALSSSTNTLFIFTEDNDQWEVTVTLPDVKAYDFSASKLYTLHSDGLLYEQNPLGENSKILSHFQNNRLALEDSEKANLTVYDENRITLLSENGGLTLWNKGSEGIHFHTMDASIQGVQFSDDGKKILYWNNTTIYTYFTREWDVQPKREEDTFLTIATFIFPIKNVSWTEQYEHILYSSENEIKIIELDHRDQRVTFTFPISIQTTSPVLQLFQEDLLFFVNESGSLNSLIFPEQPTGLFGN